MQIREWHIGIAVIVATVAFFIALTAPLTVEAPQRGMQPPQYSVQR